MGEIIVGRDLAIYGILQRGDGGIKGDQETRMSYWRLNLGGDVS